MNLSNLITRIKVVLGLYSLSLPFDNPEDAMKDVIENITLRTFSTYSPYYEKFRFDLHTLQKIERYGNQETYLLPDIFTEREILFIKEIKYDESDSSWLGYWGGGIPIMHGNMLNQGMLSNSGLALSNRMIPKVTFKYEHPRKVTLYNVLSSCRLTFEVALMHDKNLVSIPPTAEESFFNLAILDIKDMLYNTMKHYTDISSAYGNIQLKLDDWSNAASDRKALLDEWDNTYHIDVLPFEYL